MVKMDLSQMEANAEAAADLLSAMANSRRLLILCNLLEQEMNVSQLSARLGLAQSPLSQHLAKLRARGLVTARREGQQVNYALASDEVRRILATLYAIYCTPEATPPGQPR